MEQLTEVNLSETISKSRKTRAERSLEQMRKHQANPFPCPECGATINKTTVYRHNQSLHHKYIVVCKQLEELQKLEHLSKLLPLLPKLNALDEWVQVQIESKKDLA